MQDFANVSLSSFEKELVTDTKWILTKNLILLKVNHLFQQLSASYCKHSLVQQLPAEVKNILPKISRGEQYEQLPYLMLDYPRLFGKNDVFAIRTFFWWGNFFSITIHLKGIYKTQYEQQIASKLNRNADENLWINVTDEEWKFDFLPTNMQPVQQKLNDIPNKTVLRLSYKLDLNNWNEAEEFLTEKFNQLLQLLF